MAGYIDSVHQTLYGDVPQQELLEFHYRVLDYQEHALSVGSEAQGGGSAVVGADSGQTVAFTQLRQQRIGGQLRLGLDVESGEDERHRVPIAARVVDADLGLRR